MRCSRSLLLSGTLIVTLVTLCGIPAFSQDPPDVAMGMSPQATYYSGDFDFVDMATGRLNLKIPLVVDHSQRGKLNFTYNLAFTSTGSWVEVCNPVPSGCRWVIEPPMYGPSSPWLSNGGLSPTTWDSYVDDFGNIYYHNYLYEDGWGVGPSHTLGSTGGYPMESIDGSGIMSSDSMINKEGVQFKSSGGVVDANGNEMTPNAGTMTDTLGRTWTTTYNSSNVSGCPTGGPVAPTSSTIWTIPGPANVNNGVRTFKLCYSTYTISTSFNYQFDLEYYDPYQNRSCPAFS